MTKIERDAIIKKIVNLFNNKVKGRVPDTSGSDIKHDGKKGHWLEKQMGISHNANNKPDLYGFEMKNYTKSKTTFGDWSADYYIFKDKNYEIDRKTFLKTFGLPNLHKKNRHSWSGRSCPKIGDFNIFGQKLEVGKDKSISVIYSYSYDNRGGKSIIVPDKFKLDNLVLAKWSADYLRKRVESKFNNQGWFKCLIDNQGKYIGIEFGNPITFELWIDGVEKGLIFFDSGMYEGNTRNYSQWRANNAYWESLVIERY
ncbi:LlaMI family restriction endonuclease [bacterium]|nr:LlaMI family restriction endonuclease [bacterium]